MSKVKNAFHDHITDAADTRALKAEGYSDAEIAALRDPPIGEGPYDRQNAIGAPAHEPRP